MDYRRHITVLINSGFKSSSEARIFQSQFDALRESGAEIDICESASYLQRDNSTSIIIGFSSDPHFRRICENSKAIKILSLCDIYSVQSFITDDRLYSGYIMPSKNHQNFAKFLTNKPIFMLEEMSDYIFKEQYPGQSTVPRICWFGYPESFNKSMTTYLSVIDEAIKMKYVSNFTIITGHGQKINSMDSFKFQNFNINNISDTINNFDYCILSHSPLDMHINTLFKSPNKLLSCVKAGVIPICTKTPSYTQHMEKLGLADYLYDSPSSLSKILKSLISNIDRDKYEIISMQENVRLFFKDASERNLNEISHILSHSFNNDEIIVAKEHIVNMHQIPGLRRLIKDTWISIINRIRIFTGKYLGQN